MDARPPPGGRSRNSASRWAVALCWRTRTPSVRMPRSPLQRVERRRGRAVDGVVAPDPLDEVARAGDHAEGGVVVAGHALGGRVQDEVDAVLERALDERPGEGRVDHLERARDGADRVEVDELRAAGWPASRRRRRTVLPGHDGGGDGVGVGAVDERDVDAEAGQHGLEEQLVDGEELALGDDVVALRAQGEHDARLMAPMPEANASAASAPSSSATASSKAADRRVAVAAVEARHPGRGGQPQALVDRSASRRCSWPTARWPATCRWPAPGRRGSAPVVEARGRGDGRARVGVGHASASPRSSRNSTSAAPTWSSSIRKASWPCGLSIST